MVKNMPIQSGPNKPTVAIITSKYYEKLAVDAMMENKTTFVRFKSEGTLRVCVPHDSTQVILWYDGEPLVFM